MVVPNLHPSARVRPVMSGDPADCPEHVWSSVGVTAVDDDVVRVWDCERCGAWTTEPLREDRRVDWAAVEF